MKNRASLLVLLAVLTWCTTVSVAQNKSAGANSAFDKLKSLAGEWQGTNPEGRETMVSYQIVSGGTAVMETLQPRHEPSMITLYHLDGNKLMMTHYCSIGNQPRMLAEAPTGEIKKLSFTFIDVANLTDAAQGHMVGLDLIFQDENHLTQVWTWQQEGKDTAGTFIFGRKK